MTAAHLIAVNHEFAVLLCKSPGCRHAVTLAGIAEHLRKFHHEKTAIRKDVEEFRRALTTQDTRFLCDYRSVRLPVCGSAPQPVLPVVSGFSLPLLPLPHCKPS